MAKTKGYAKDYRRARRAFGRPIVSGGSVVANAVLMGAPKQVRAALPTFTIGQLRRAESELASNAERGRARGWTGKSPGLDMVRAELRRRGI